MSDPKTKSSSSFAIRIAIVDDHPAVREGLALLLHPKGIVVCAEAGSCEEALPAVLREKPDVVLVDLSLGSEDGTALLEKLHSNHFPSLVYSMYEDGRKITDAFLAGAQGYVTKREVHGVLVHAIAEVAQGRRYVSPRAAVALAEYAVSRPKDNPLTELSVQEQQVYRLLEQGKSTRSIAEAMGISVRTVESYCERICVKLDLEGMRALRIFAESHHSEFR